MLKWISGLWAKLSDPQKAWARSAAGYAVAVAVTCAVHAICGCYKLPEPPLPTPVPPGPIPLQQQADGDGGNGQPGFMKFGWTAPSEEERKAALAAISAKQGFPADSLKAVAAKAMYELDDGRSVFMWDAEVKVLKLTAPLPAWNQGQIGSCVSHGWGRGCQDLLLSQIASGAAEEWPGAEVCREAIYGGSRVQSGHDGGGGDGSTGSWAAQWVTQDGGVVFYLKYPGEDLTNGYQVSRCKQWGSRGCPSDLVPTAKEHPVKSAAMVKTSDDVWAALGSGYPVPICSGVGFQSPLVDGFCARRGSWAHCMEVRGRFNHPQKGKCFVIQNSWGDYLKSQEWHAYLATTGLKAIQFVGAGNNVIATTDRGDVTLPQGCFGVTAADMDVIVRENDSYAISGFKGFPAQNIDWFAQLERRRKEYEAVLIEMERDRQLMPVAVQMSLMGQPHPCCGSAR